MSHKWKLSASLCAAISFSLAGTGIANADFLKDQNIAHADRASILNTGNPSVLVGISTELSKSEDIQTVVSDTLAFSNDLSRQTRTIVSIIPNRDDRIYNDDIKNKRFKYVFCELRDCFVAMSFGYSPIAKREDLQRAVLLTRGAENIRSERDIPKNAKIGFYGDGVLRVMAAAFKTAANKQLVDLNGFSRSEVGTQMMNGTVDAMIVSSNDVVAIVGKQTTEFSSQIRSEPVPNALLLSRSDVSRDEAINFAMAFINATPKNMSQLMLTPDINPSYSTFQTINKLDLDTVGFVYKRSASIRKIDAKNQPSFNK